MAATRLAVILYGLTHFLRFAALRDAGFRARLKEKRFVAQIRTRDGGVARSYEFTGRGVRSRRGLHPAPEVTLTFATAALGARLMTPPIDWSAQIAAQKNFTLTLDGPDELACWFAQTVIAAARAGAKAGTKRADGTTRYTTMTNGGPLFVFVKDGRIVRVTPIEFGADDGASWTIEARGRRFTPPRTATVAPHALNWKSAVYSPDRLLYPMKRVDFDPDGAAPPGNPRHGGL